MLGTGLMLLGIFLFAVLHASTHGTGEASVVLQGTELMLALLIVIAITAVLLVGHEWVHGLTMRRYGARPEYGAGMLGKFMPVLYCTAPGHKFTRKQFAAVAVAPLLVISLVGALCVAFVPLGGWLVVPLGFHLGGCVGDLWFLGILSRQSGGTLIEDLKTGVRFHYPAAQRAC